VHNLRQCIAASRLTAHTTVVLRGVATEAVCRAAASSRPSAADCVVVLGAAGAGCGLREVGDAVDVLVMLRFEAGGGGGAVGMKDILGQPIVKINTPHHRPTYTIRVRELLLQIERILVIIRHKLIAIANLHHLSSWVILRRHIRLRNHVLNFSEREDTRLADAGAGSAETAGRAAEVVACGVGEGVAAAVGGETHVDFGHVDAGGGESGDGGVDDADVGVAFDVGGGVAVGVEVV